MTADHPWQEYNEHGNTCHRPGCTLGEKEHDEPRSSRVRSADVTPPLRNVQPEVPDVRA